jgi:LysR family glycine cleavage system transcriptional activator
MGIAVMYQQSNTVHNFKPIATARPSLVGANAGHTTLARLPPLTSLRAFVATARHLSFQGAAEELHVTSAAVGQQVRLLEDHLGQLLFHRNRGRLELTDTGQALMPGLTDAFHAVVESVAKIVSGDNHGPIRVSVAPSFASKWLIPRLGALRRAAPGLEILLDSSPQIADLENGEADCVIRYGTGAYPGLDVDILFSEAVVPICSPAFAEEFRLHSGQAGLGVTPLLHEEGAEHDLSCPDWNRWLRANGMSHQVSARGVRLNQSALAIDAAVAGQGLALAKLRLVDPELRSGRVIIPFGKPHPVQFSYFFAATPRAARLSGVRLFREWLQAEAAQELPLGAWQFPLEPVAA